MSTDEIAKVLIRAKNGEETAIALVSSSAKEAIESLDPESANNLLGGLDPFLPYAKQEELGRSLEYI